MSEAAFRVEVRAPGAEPEVVVIDRAVVFGREGADHVVADQQVSRLHLRFYVHEGRLVVEDLDSSNGTTVNGERIDGAVYVEVGDRVELGGTDVTVLEPVAGPAAVVEVRPVGVSPWVLAIEGSVVVGRAGDVQLADDGASRRHLELRVEGGRLVVQDLGSRNGTTVDGAPITGAVTVQPGQDIGLGSSHLVVLDPSDPDVQARAEAPRSPDPSMANRPTSPAPGEPASTPAAPVAPPVPEAPPAAPAVPPVPEAPAAAPPTPAPSAAPMAQRPALFELSALDEEAVTVRFVPGTAGARAAPGVLRAAKAARRTLAGFGSEGWGVVPQICLVDPFPDPEHPGHVITEGTLVDAVHGEVWMVVTDERPPERPERPLAHLFGGALPAVAELEVLIEGYGLHLAGAPDPDEQLRLLELPPLEQAEGELRSAMAVSFVRNLIGRDGEEAFVRLLGTAQPSRVDAAAEQTYGLNRTALELAWRQELLTGGPRTRPAQFLRLSWRYLRPHKARQVEIFVYMLFALAFTTVFPFASRRLFDTALPSGEFSQVAEILVALGIAFILSMLAGLRQAYLTAYVSSAVVRSMREEMFHKIQQLPSSWFHRHQQGDVLTRLFNDVAQVEAGLTQTLSQGIFQLLTLVVSAVVMLTLNVPLGVIVLIGAPVVALVYRAMGKGAQERSLAVQEETGGLMGIAAENYGAQTVVKVFGLHRREQDRFSRRSERLFRAERRLALWGGIFGLSVNMIVTLLRLGILGLGAWLILEGHFTLGGLVAFMGVMGEVLNPVTALTTIGQALQSATGALMRIEEVLDEAPGVEQNFQAPPAPPLTSEIRLADISFSYTSERRALSDIDVTIPAGSRVGFVGPSGSGKSTVLRLLMRLHDPDEGVVLFDGIDIRQYDPGQLRSQLGVVFQDNFLFDTTIRENIALGFPGATDAQVVEAARAAEVDEFIDQLPRGYDSPVGERGDLLSGGQRQRVAIARALIRNPRVLLLDEATSALDPRTERQITATLDRLSEGRTTIAITHRLTSVTTYDRLFVIAAGQLVEQGTHDELVAAGGLYAKLWAEQTGQAVAPEMELDVAAALARIPVFDGLTAEQLEVVRSRLKPADLRPGAEVAEGGGQLVLIARGRARVLAPSLGPERVATAELGAGDTFGVGALLGQPTGLVLVAVEPTRVLLLDDEAIAGLGAVMPEIGRRLAGDVAPAVAPSGGSRLTQATFMGRLPAASSAAH